MTIASDFQTGIGQIIAQLGSNVTYTQNAGGTHTLRVAVTQIPRDEGELVNALGLEGSMCYLAPPGFTPVKFDSITMPTGRIYNVEFVSEVIIDSNLAAYKLGLKT